MKKSLRQFQKGIYPSHHLWGAANLLSMKDVDVKILSFERFPQINRYWRIQTMLGMNQLEMIALDQQLRVLIKRNYDVVYSACQDHTFLLSSLRRVGLFRKPIITTIHHPLTLNQAKKTQLEGYDRFIVLSRIVYNTLIQDLRIDTEKVCKFDWGPDVSFYGDYVPVISDYKKNEIPLIVSAGKANRDFSTLIKAVDGIRCLLKIYGSSNSLQHLTQLPNNVSVIQGERNKNPITYLEMIEIYKKAQIIAIPLNKVDKLAGLTSLLDALAIGRPVIMTRNKYVDIDIEKEGIGIWVSPDDNNGWTNAIQRIIKDPLTAADMGARARQLCTKKYNIDGYTNQLYALITQLSG